MLERPTAVGCEAHENGQREGSHFALQPGARLLELLCGYARLLMHAPAPKKEVSAAESQSLSEQGCVRSGHRERTRVRQEAAAVWTY